MRQIKFVHRYRPQCLRIGQVEFIFVFLNPTQRAFRIKRHPDPETRDGSSIFENQFVQGNSDEVD